MKNIILFDQDTQHYRQSIYLYFKQEFFKQGYNLIVVYDKKLNSIENETDFFIGIDYTFYSFLKIIRKFQCRLIIQFVWLRYKFLLPLMVFNRIRGVKTIVWSHGINLQNKNQKVKNLIYYIRQYLANGLIIYTPEQKIYIKASHKKLFIANNTLAFDDLPKIILSKEELKQKYNYANKKVILSVGRFDVNNRKASHLIELAKLLDDEYYILIVGPGLSIAEETEIDKLKNIYYKGAIYDQTIICELYKMADLFIMPGAIGLAINQAQYFETPVILEDVDHGPEGYYLKEGYNGFLYKANDIEDLRYKVLEVLESSNYEIFRKNAKTTSNDLGSFDKMLSGFLNAIEYVEKKK